jgi:hypothetical protein
VVKTYRILFLGLLEDPDRFKENMSGMGVQPEVTDKMLQRAPILMKTGMALAEARRYAEAVQKAGGRVNIQEDGGFQKPRDHRRPIKPLEYFTMCLECGHKQPRSERCVRCGCAFPRSAEGDVRGH